MKRSEALKIIDKVLFDNEVYLPMGVDKAILSALEKAGVLPPPYEIIDRFVTNGDPMSTQNYYVYGVPDWEDEDEKA